MPPTDLDPLAGTDGDADVVLGPFKPDQLPHDAPAGALVRVDLTSWHSNTREVLRERLHALVIPQRWDGATIGVLGAYLDQVAPLVRDVAGDLEPSLDAATAVTLDCTALEPAAREALAKALDESRLAFQLWSGELKVAAGDRDRVTRVINDLRAGNVARPFTSDDAASDDDFQGAGDEHAFAALDALYQAVDAVRRHPDRMHEIDALADACTRCPVGAPFGVEPAIWHDLVAQAGALADKSRALDTDEIRARATTLHERLHHLVA